MSDSCNPMDCSPYCRWILYWLSYQYSKVVQLYMYIYLFFSRFFSNVGYYRILSRITCAIQKVLADYNIHQSVQSLSHVWFSHHLLIIVFILFVPPQKHWHFCLLQGGSVFIRSKQNSGWHTQKRCLLNICWLNEQGRAGYLWFWQDPWVSPSRAG